ncbi:MAG: GNAT family N-acetyltransferase [Methanomicrobiales archaeon]|nr:GNAT family N-acetyltransferase [Methanomicrobiales archaeon]
MAPTEMIEIRRVGSWDVNEIAGLYREGGWWRDEWDPQGLADLIRGSFAFFVAVEPGGSAVGMGRVIADGVSDAYIQDLVVGSAYRGRGIGDRILGSCVTACHEAGITWIALIAEPDTERFYQSRGFVVMEHYTPMKFGGDDHPCSQ